MKIFFSLLAVVWIYHIKSSLFGEVHLQGALFTYSSLFYLLIHSCKSQFLWQSLSLCSNPFVEGLLLAEHRKSLLEDTQHSRAREQRTQVDITSFCRMTEQLMTQTITLFTSFFIIYFQQVVKARPSSRSSCFMSFNVQFLSDLTISLDATCYC